MPIPVFVKAVVVGAGTVLLKVAPSVFESVKNTAEKRADDRQERTKTWPEVPDLIGVHQSDAREAIEKTGLVFTPRLAEAKVEYKDKRLDTVVAMSHKAKSRVQPGGAITVTYITEEVIQESQQLHIDAEVVKEQKKRERRDKIAELQDQAKNVLPRKTKETVSKEELI